MDRCPHCGSEDGVYTTYTGIQQYSWKGEPNGYFQDVAENETKFAKCVHCGRKVSMNRILKESALARLKGRER